MREITQLVYHGGGGGSKRPRDGEHGRATKLASFRPLRALDLQAHPCEPPGI